jgi:hypothetical protein
MDKYPLNTRNETHEFARRTSANLDFIERAKVHSAQVHLVAQLTILLLGLVVFPEEKLLLRPGRNEDRWRHARRKLACMDAHTQRSS